MNILLTGGAGYIGSHAALALIDAGHKVHIIDDLSTGNVELIPRGSYFTECNINDSKKINEVLQKSNFDILMHFAGFVKVEESVEKPNKYFDNNTKNAIILFENCRKNNLKKIIFSSTAASYGHTKKNLITENQELNPQNPYAESKIKTENFLKANSKDFNYIILRYFNVAGADFNFRSGQISKNSTHLIKILSEAAVGKRSSIEIYGNDYNTPDGTAIRDYIHVSDLADIHLEAAKYLQKNMSSNIFNCGYGNGYSVLEVVNMFNSLSEIKIKFDYTDRRKGDVECLVSDIDKLKNHFNWKPKYNNLQKIIRSSIDWEKKLDEKNI